MFYSRRDLISPVIYRRNGYLKETAFFKLKKIKKKNREEFSYLSSEVSSNVLFQKETLLLKKHTPSNRLSKL